ncbi:MAG: YqzL family protein [Bacillota bacterium]
MKLAKAFWSVFEKTGSVMAYLLYRHYLELSTRFEKSEVQ